MAEPISPLRQRMIEDMSVRNFVEKTHEYIRDRRAVPQQSVLHRSR